MRYLLPLMAVSIALIIYGYTCRWFNIYFFWESLITGWLLLAATITAWLFVKWNQSLRGKRSWLFNVSVGIACCLFAWVPSILFVFSRSNAYKDALMSLGRNAAVIKQVGTLQGASLLPAGYLQWTSHQQEGLKSEFRMTLKGSKSYRDIRVELVKTGSGAWEIIKWE